MKKRLLSLLTVVLLLSITAVSSFATSGGPDENPLIYKQFNDYVELITYGNSTSQCYDDIEHNIFELGYCPVCGNPVLYNNWLFEKNGYINKESISSDELNGFYIFGSYSLNQYDYLPLSIGGELKLYDTNEIEPLYTPETCAYTRGDDLQLTFDVEWTDVISIFSHMNLDFANTDIFEIYNLKTNSGVVIRIKEDNYFYYYDLTTAYKNNFNKIDRVDDKFEFLNAVKLFNYRIFATSAFDKVLYDDIYFDGYREGEDSGLLEGYEDGYESGLSKGQDVGYKEGYDKGYEIGHDNGENIGYENGVTVGRADGYINGHTDGYNDGYKQGRIEGQKESDFFDNGLDNLFQKLFDGLGTFLTPFLNLGWGNLTIGSVLGFIGVVVLVLFAVKIIRGI